jgi:hypothetical protein
MKTRVTAEVFVARPAYVKVSSENGLHTRLALLNLESVGYDGHHMSKK